MSKSITRSGAGDSRASLALSGASAPSRPGRVEAERQQSGPQTGSLLSLFDGAPRALETLMWAGVGGAVGAASGLAAGPFIGALVVTFVAAWAGRSLHFPAFGRELALFCLGIGAGGYVTPDFLVELLRQGLALGLGPFVAMMFGAVGFAVLAVVFRLDRRTAFDAIAPETTLLLAPGHEAAVPGAAGPRYSGLRLLIILAAAPALTLAAPGIAPDLVEPAPLSDWAFLILAALAGGFGARAAKAPAPWLLGAFLASAAMHGFGLISTGHVGPGYQMALAALGGLSAAAIAGRVFPGLAAAGEPAAPRRFPAIAFAPRVIGPPIWFAATALAILSAGLALGGGWLAGHWTGALWPAAALALAPIPAESAIALAFAFGFAPGLVALAHIAWRLLVPSAEATFRLLGERAFGAGHAYARRVDPAE